MTCKVITTAGGGTAIICNRGSKRCQCGRSASKLCDYPLTGSKVGQTCDVPLCNKCAVNIDKNKDYCRAHYRISMNK